jgi:Ca-activated chloride channel family protein
MSFAAFHFLRPGYLLLLLPTAVIFYQWLKHKQGRGNWLEVCDAELLPFLLADKPLEKSRTSLIVAALASLLVILALAGPTWQRLPSPAFRNDSALVIALDLSVSMDAADIKPTRLQKARYKIADLLKQRKDGQTALLVYAGDAFTVTPLTTDTATIISQLEALTTDIMPSSGSNTGVAIHKAVDLLQQAGITQGHILLITDSVDPEGLAEAEKGLSNYRLSVLAVGSGEGAPIQKLGGGFVKDASGNMLVAHLDSQGLASLAEQGNGLFQTVSASDEDIENLQKFFNSGLPTENKALDSSQLLQQWDEFGPWLVLLVLPWAALRFRKGLLIFFVLCLLPLPRNSQALDWQSLWQNANQRAQQAFNQQQYQQAAEQFASPEWRAAAQYKAGEYQQAAETLKTSQTPDGYYNRGNALAKAGDLKGAIQAYDQALKLQSDHQDAKFNKDLVEKQLQQQQQEQQQQSQEHKSSDQQNKQQEQNQDNQPGKNQQQPEEGKQDAEQHDQQQQPEKPSEQAGKEAKPDPANADKNAQTKPQNAEQKPEPSKDAQNQTAKSASELEKDEAERADEQLLKRIPDEPTGLLKRKFRYQYSQRQNAGQNPLKW